MEGNISGVAHLTDVSAPCEYDAAEEINSSDAYEAYHKRVSDFDYIAPPRKRVPAAPDQDAPANPRMPRAAPPVAQHPNSPFPPPPVRPPRQAAAAPAGPAVYRPRRSPGEPTGRTDPVPSADPAVVDQQITNDIIQRVGKYPVPLRMAVECDPVQIYAKVGSQLLQTARRKQLANPTATPVLPTPTGGPAPRNPFGPQPPLNPFRSPATGAPLRDGPTPMETNAAIHNATPSPHAWVPSQCWQVRKADVFLANAHGNWTPITAIVDSGASHSVITRNTLRQLDLLEALQES